MAGTTPNLGLYLPGGGSTGTWVPDEVADVDPINQNFQKIDLFAGTVGVQTSRNQQFYGPAGAIASVTGQKLGDEYQESDGGKKLWRYDGANWIQVVQTIGGVFNAATDGQGYLTIPHSLGRIPVFAWATLNDDTPLVGNELRLNGGGIQMTATNFKIRVYRFTAGAWSAFGNNGVTVTWGVGG